MSDGSGAVSADLVRLAHDVVAYVGGTRDSVPHTGEIELRIGGARVGTATLPTGPSGPRTLNAACPHGQSTYAAAVCPVDLFGPIKNARINNVGLTYAPDVAPILCAPPREGPPPRGSVIVLRPVEAWRTCASDFELVLMSDGHGRVTGIDLTLSEP
ncbi:hypothetical protein [Nocardioides jejuensis]|uniref:Uncharacterized protein n=1 Tax=Nocardioides jejuensis TaxID=2502782 RepID=A0A4R1CH76_9ACTN|nr:hypothetical protein [Nocardioides jejuensis]TCJ30753.1 hypothetical protein EPD65_01580 [Nocardioides jejuensis]